MHGSYTANNAIQNSDCIIALGTRFDDRIRGNKNNYAPKAKEDLEPLYFGPITFCISTFVICKNIL